MKLSLFARRPVESPPSRSPNISLLPQSGAPTGKIGPSSVWQIPSTFPDVVHKACDSAAQPPSFADCFINQMSKAGASPAAVAFTRMLQKQSGGDVGVMSGFNKVGPVDVAFVVYPLRANTNNGILFVNGTPEDRQRRGPASCSIRQPCNRVRSSRTPRRNSPRSACGPATATAPPGPTPTPIPRAACRSPWAIRCSTAATPAQRVGTVEFNWKFGPTGKFLGTIFMGMTPPPVQ